LLSLKLIRDFTSTIKSEDALKEAAIKKKIIARHNKKFVKQEFKVCDFVLQRKQKDSKEGKFATNWGGSYRIFLKMGMGASGLEVGPRHFSMRNL
jgi:hypothetical protein